MDSANTAFHRFAYVAKEVRDALHPRLEQLEQDS
jgi:hypothetical protein